MVASPPSVTDRLNLSTSITGRRRFAVAAGGALGAVARALVGDIVGRTDWIEDAVSRLSQEVYVTIDLDALDPSVLPATGTPEPGGLGWYELLALLRETARRREVIGADLVELSPLPGQHASDFLAAKLALKVVTYAREAEIRALSG